MTAVPPPNRTPQLGEPDEHPLSVLVFSWMRSKVFFRSLLVGLLAIGGFMIGLELLAAPRAGAGVDGLPGFFGGFGFIAFGLAALSAWPLGALMRRPEHYYDADNGEGGDDG